MIIPLQWFQFLSFSKTLLRSIRVPCAGGQVLSGLSSCTAAWFPLPGAFCTAAWMLSRSSLDTAAWTQLPGLPSSIMPLDSSFPACK